MNKDSMAELGGFPRIAVAIATFGRPAIISNTVRDLIRNQLYLPEVIIIACTKAEDIGDICDEPSIVVVIGPAGTSCQRNNAISVIPPHIDVVVFFDDDFVAAPDWLFVTAKCFLDRRDITSITGKVIADGVKSAGISFENAKSLIKATKVSVPGDGIEFSSPYGCNMAFRMSSIKDVRFDERLVLYGWLEDVDFGATLMKLGGKLVKLNTAIGVHMGAKSGRVPGVRFGYSQIINPVYIMKKGNMTLYQAIRQIARNVLSNVRGFIVPESYIDRRGRLKGNMLGFVDLARGRLRPENAQFLG